MIIDKKSFTKFGELVSSDLEGQYKDDYWKTSKMTIFISYNICCVLMLFAGIFFDYSRHFYWGSADTLTFLRVILMLSGFAMFPIFWKSKTYPKLMDYYCFYLMMFSTVLICLLTLMTKGSSFTLMPGILMMSVSFYVALPSRFFHALISSTLLVITYCVFFDYAKIGLGFKAHFYMCFMLVAINIVMIYFKIMNSKNARVNFLLREYHREVSNAKNTILSIIGHDLKNPLTIVKNLSHLMRKDVSKERYDRIPNHLDKIEKSNDRVEELLQSLLGWALSEKTESVSELSPSDIEDPCKNAIEFCNELAEVKSIILALDVESHNFKFNSNMVETVVRNLLSNSIKFTPENKTVTIEGKKDGEVYRLKIKDEGIGLSDEMKEKILNGQNTSTTLGTNGEKGTGVGLRLVHHFINTHNGNFDINSQEGIGSEFIIDLPIDS